MHCCLDVWLISEILTIDPFFVLKNDEKDEKKSVGNTLDAAKKPFIFYLQDKRFLCFFFTICNNECLED